MIYTPQQLRDEAEKEAEYFPWSGPQARAAKDRAHAAALEELAAANRQLDDCEHGYATLKADLAAANAKLAAKPDVAGLVERIRAYLCMGGLWNPDLANHDAVRDLIIDSRDALLSLSAQLADCQETNAIALTKINEEHIRANKAEAECEGLRQDAERLDWLDSAESSLVGGSTTDGTIRWGFTTPDPGIEWTLRDAIDAAITAREP